MLRFLLLTGGLIFLASINKETVSGIGTINTLSDFANKCLKDNTPRKIKVNDVSDIEIKKLQEIFKIDFTGYKHVIDNYAVKHSINKHGKQTESLRGQKVLTTSDFNIIPFILNNPDSIQYGGKSKIGKDIIIYSKIINNEIIYIEEIRTGKKELALLTFYIKKAHIKQA